MTRWILGIDPGCPGGWAVLDQSGHAVACGEGALAERGGLAVRSIDDVRHPLDQVKGERPALCAVIEQFTPRPNMNVKSIAGLWRGVGAWEIIAGAAGWPEPTRVDPKSWQSMPDVAPAIKAAKDEARASAGFVTLSKEARNRKLQEAGKRGYHTAALARWPDQRSILVGPRGGARLDPAAALWIAEYARLHAPRR